MENLIDLPDHVLRTFRCRHEGVMSVEMVCEKMRMTKVESFYGMLEFRDGRFELEGRSDLVLDRGGPLTEDELISKWRETGSLMEEA